MDPRLSARQIALGSGIFLITALLLQVAVLHDQSRIRAIGLRLRPAATQPSTAEFEQERFYGIAPVRQILYLPSPFQRIDLVHQPIDR